MLGPVAFEACFVRYPAALPERVQGAVAIDGKTVRHSFERQNGRTPLPLIGAWACERRLVLGQLRVEDKSNEIPALARAREDHAPRTSPGCAASPSTSRAPTASKARPGARSRAPAATSISSSSSAPPPDAIALRRRHRPLAIPRPSR